MAEEINKALEETPGLGEEHDWFLGALVSIVNHGSQVGMTLQVSGFLVSGLLVGGAEYFEGFASEFSSVFPNIVREEVRKSIAVAGEPYKEAAEKADLSSPIQFVHLKDARFFNTSGKPIPGNRGVWWRGRLSEVSGFILGTLGTDDAV